ncbi:hypothetical protein M409DRAFT_54891 [Zasmidium cellare ATCC 36951]|uniref:Uncharacterized protein n=1 Tax=Zasmidium cellare ATCC 36951 TaxID=1080233 RepID=A0A6A6CH78_ZASCE|nr:uncharacterized protein M409DRAFT_54891 [Zasmidium cellare ATCC 36951]KAF2166554.1 hypothetical protein M409DRAFT_54891 [Zasmidium cellare ATCC 36951]
MNALSRFWLIPAFAITILHHATAQSAGVQVWIDSNCRGNEVSGGTLAYGPGDSCDNLGGNSIIVEGSGCVTTLWENADCGSGSSYVIPDSSCHNSPFGNPFGLVEVNCPSPS